MIYTVYFESLVIYFFISCTLRKHSAIIVINIMYHRSKASVLYLQFGSYFF